jgi:hypothetical protein
LPFYGKQNNCNFEYKVAISLPKIWKFLFSIFAAKNYDTDYFRESILFIHVCIQMIVYNNITVIFIFKCRYAARR